MVSTFIGLLGELDYVVKLHSRIKKIKLFLYIFLVLDIQSWWEIPCISHFCSLFSSAFDLPDIDIEVIA